MTVRRVAGPVAAAALILGVASFGLPTTASAITHHPIGQFQTAPERGDAPEAQGQTATPIGCAATASEMPVDSPAIAGGDLGAAQGPGTAGTAAVSPTADVDCAPQTTQ
jgi:hypothetical protein